MTTKLWKPIGSSKLIRHPRWDFFAPVNSTGRGVPPPTSTSHLQLLWQAFPSMQCEDRTDNFATDCWDLHKKTLDLAPRPLASSSNLITQCKTAQTNVDSLCCLFTSCCNNCRPKLSFSVMAMSFWKYVASVSSNFDLFSLIMIFTYLCILNLQYYFSHGHFCAKDNI